MKKRVFTILAFFVFIAWSISTSQHEKTRPTHQSLTFHEHSPSSEVKASSLPPEAERRPAQVVAPPKLKPKKSKLSADQLGVYYQLNQHAFIAKDVIAVAKKDYSPSLGEIIDSDYQFHYLRSEDSSSGKLSVYDAKKKRLLPLSPFIKVRNTDEIKREEILSRGYQEYLYLEEMELLFVRTDTSNFKEIFESLKREGHTPQFQVFDRQYRPK